MVWHESLNGAPSTIKGKRFEGDGSARGGEFRVLGRGPGFFQGEAIAAMDAKGRFVVGFGWFVDTGPFGSESVGVFARRFNQTGRPQGEEFRVSGFGNVQFRGEMGMAMNDAGDFVLAWIANESPFGGDTFLHTRLFKAPASAATGDRKFAFAEPGIGPRDAAVAMDEAGNFVAAWQQRGIYAHRHAGPRNKEPACSRYIAALLGTHRPETIDGTSEDDVIHAMNGDDIVRGREGDDIVCGGRGADQLFGEEGDDLLFGGPGDDVLDGGPESDLCDGGGHVNSDTAVSCEQTEGVP